MVLLSEITPPLVQYYKTLLQMRLRLRCTTHSKLDQKSMRVVPMLVFLVLHTMCTSQNFFPYYCCSSSIRRLWRPCITQKVWHKKYRTCAVFFMHYAAGVSGVATSGVVSVDSVVSSTTTSSTVSSSNIYVFWLRTTKDDRCRTVTLIVRSVSLPNE